MPLSATATTLAPAALALAFAPPAPTVTAVSTQATAIVSADIRLVQWPHDAKDATCGRVGRPALFLAFVWVYDLFTYVRWRRRAFL